MDTEVLKITLKIGDVQIDLSPNQIKDLRNALNKLFPVGPIEYIPIYPHYPRWEWSGPYWTTTSDNTLYMTNTPI